MFGDSRKVSVAMITSGFVESMRVARLALFFVMLRQLTLIIFNGLEMGAAFGFLFVFLMGVDDSCGRISRISEFVDVLILDMSKE